MTKSPMKTITTDRMGASSTGLTMTRSITTPNTKAMPTVRKKAAQ